MECNKPLSILIILSLEDRAALHSTLKHGATTVAIKHRMLEVRVAAGMLLKANLTSFWSTGSRRPASLSNSCGLGSLDILDAKQV